MSMIPQGSTSTAVGSFWDMGAKESTTSAPGGSQPFPVRDSIPTLPTAEVIAQLVNGDAADVNLVMAAGRHATDDIRRLSSTEVGRTLASGLAWLSPLAEWRTRCAPEMVSLDS